MSRPLDRLVGLETEYAIRFAADHPHAEQPTDFELYSAVRDAIRQQTLVVPAADWKEGVFLGTGGAVWFEQVRYSGGFGLVEGSTPECRGPLQAVTYQRGQDALLEEACQNAAVPGTLALIKNDRDSLGNVYGAQENYEISHAAGWRSVCWKLCLALLVPFLIIGWLGQLLLFALTMAWVIVAGLTWMVLQLLLPESWHKPVVRLLLGDDFARDRGFAAPVPEWVEVAALGLIRIFSLPAAVVLYAGVRWCTFPKLRGDLLPFLMTRPLIGGAGMLDARGRLRLSDKADAINCQIGYNGLVWDRPIFSIGHFFKSLMFKVWSSPREFLRLMEPRQRLQVCLGDSNMAEEAELLRIGTTMLVIDASEAGCFTDRPRVRRPLSLMRKVCGDPDFNLRYRVGKGRKWSSIDIQQYYCDVCTSYVEAAGDVSDEARDILQRWQAVLADLREDRSRLVGRLDWVTKEMLFREAGGWESTGAQAKPSGKLRPAMDHERLRKIEIRYHELSPDGYFRQLQSAEVPARVVNDADVSHARRLPPGTTPASARGRYIREFSDSDVPFRVSWNTVILGRGPRAKVIELTPPAAKQG